MAFLAQRLQILDLVNDFRIEDRAYGDSFDVMGLKIFLTAAPGALPPVPLKRQKAVGEIGFIVVLGGQPSDIRDIDDWIVFFRNSARARW